MTTLKLTAHIDEDGRMRLDVPTDLPSGDVDLVLTIQESPARQPGARYDLSDLTGRLQWQGDPVQTQRSLRDEWP